MMSSSKKMVKVISGREIKDPPELAGFNMEGHPVRNANSLISQQGIGQPELEGKLRK